MDYDLEYYIKYCQEAGKYNVLRPVRRALTMRTLLFPSDPSVAIFGMDNVTYYQTWVKAFSKIVGYDVNPVVKKYAETFGLSDSIHLQDVSVPFEPVERTHLAVCYYLFEHLSDDRCAVVVENLIAHAPVNLIVLTPVTDEHYKQDPTHCNPKTNRQWSAMIRALYKKSGWKRWSGGSAWWCFVDGLLFDRLKSIQPTLAYHLEKSWDGMIDD